MINKFHPFHIVNQSPWPILSSIIALIITIQTTLAFINNTQNSLINSLFILTSFTGAIWWTDTFNESSNEGLHQKTVVNGLNIGIVIFIISEVIFFSSFFWSYFHQSIGPNLEIGQTWPPNSINSFNPVNVPLLNTLILISSGVTVTWSHHCVLKSSNNNALISITITCLLGLYFSVLQFLEYKQSEFIVNDSSYGSIFFIATGFHGIHVLIGTTFLLTTLFFINNFSISNVHHISFEIAAWYWHFVDVVWLFLYLSIYWWGK